MGAIAAHVFDRILLTLCPSHELDRDPQRIGNGGTKEGGSNLISDRWWNRVE